jgi:hypothetical protein
MLVVRTTLAHKRKESEALAFRIKRTSFEMFPCSGCKKRNLKCVVSDKENSGCCFKCVLRKAKCNAKGIPVGKWRLLKLETDCLERESKAAIHAVCENMACLKRLEKQKKFLKSKGKDIVRHGLKTLDKLKEAKEKERQIETERTTAKVAAMPSNVLALLSTKVNPFAGVKVLLLLPEV